MSASTPGPFKRILVAVDGSAHALDATRVGARLARALGAEMTILTVYHAPSTALGEPNYSEALTEALEGARHVVEEARRVAVDAGGPEPGTEWLAGAPDDVIVSAARDGSYDLVVVGTRGLGRLGTAILGSISSVVAGKAGRPVLVVGERD